VRSEAVASRDVCCYENKLSKRLMPLLSFSENFDEAMHKERIALTMASALVEEPFSKWGDTSSRQNTINNFFTLN